MDSKQLAKLTITRLTRPPTDYREAMQQQPGESLDAYSERLDALNLESGGKVCGIYVHNGDQLQEIWPFINWGIMERNYERPTRR